jgi:hypothetical protein
LAHAQDESAIVAQLNHTACDVERGRDGVLAYANANASQN